MNKSTSKSLQKFVPGRKTGIAAGGSLAGLVALAGVAYAASKFRFLDGTSTIQQLMALNDGVIVAMADGRVFWTDTMPIVSLEDMLEKGEATYYKVNLTRRTRHGLAIGCINDGTAAF
jgi:hypothetical protein